MESAIQRNRHWARLVLLAGFVAAVSGVYGVIRWSTLFTGIGILVALGAAALAVDTVAPRRKVVWRTWWSGRPAAEVWRALTDIARFPDWHPEVRAVHRLLCREGREVWRETYRGGKSLTWETTTANTNERPWRFVRAIADETCPWRAEREYRVVPIQGGCKVTIFEFGDIPNGFLRLFQRLTVNTERELDEYLKALAAMFGEPAAVDHLL